MKQAGLCFPAVRSHFHCLNMHICSEQISYFEPGLPGAIRLIFDRFGHNQIPRPLLLILQIWNSQIQNFTGQADAPPQEELRRGTLF